ncbi:MAG: helix-turn-helix domain-containing protein [bacterium]|jgi:transcriptional regulator with XRE-family HTH domain
MTFGARLRQLREEKELSQIDLAKQLKIANSTLSLYESDKREPDHETVKKIANHFSVSLDWLLGRTNIRNPIETIAAHRSDDPMDELPEEARKSLEEYKEFILKKYGYKK